MINSNNGMGRTLPQVVKRNKMSFGSKVIKKQKIKNTVPNIDLHSSKRN